jgi:hypothetical protein
MGVLDIRMRSANLGNIGAVRSVNTDNGAAAAWVSAAKMGEQIGSGLANLGKGVVSILAAAKKEEDDRKENLYIKEMQEGMNAFNNGNAGGAQLPETYSEVIAGYRIGTEGAMNEDMADTKKWLERNEKFRKDYAHKLRVKHQLNDEQMERVGIRLNGFNISTTNAWNKRSSTVQKARDVAAAKDVVALSMQAVTALPAVSATQEEAQAAADSWQELDDSWEMFLNTTGEYDPVKRKEFKRTEAMKVNQMLLSKYIQDIQLSTMDSIDPKAVKQKWDDALKMVKDADEDSFLPPSSWVMGEDGKPVNALKKHLEGMDFASMKKAAILDFEAQARKAESESRGRRLTVQQDSAVALKDEFRKTTAGLEDTERLMAAKLETRESYGKRLNDMVEAGRLDAKTADSFFTDYSAFLDRRDIVITAYDQFKKTGKGGVMTERVTRDGRKVMTFEPDRYGSTAKRGDPTVTNKYTKLDRNGNLPFYDNPQKGMESLEYDLSLGRITVKFYNAQMQKYRVLSDTKAKAAFVRIFGANEDIFPKKDLDMLKKQGLDLDEKSVYAKTAEWNRRHENGDWLYDVTNSGWFERHEKKVTLEQQAQLCEIVMQLTAEGIDPQDTIRAYLAPVFAEWAATDLDERLNPDSKRGGMSLRERLLRNSKRFSSENNPDARDERLRGKQKEFYKGKSV